LVEKILKNLLMNMVLEKKKLLKTHIKKRHLFCASLIKNGLNNRF
jgi:hypothetical protein